MMKLLYLVFHAEDYIARLAYALSESRDWSYMFFPCTVIHAKPCWYTEEGHCYCQSAIHRPQQLLRGGSTLDPPMQPRPTPSS
jgi:hypothetical protein